MKMIERRYTVRFLTPAFLGDAEQNARWRTPPFKHLLREWWRVAYAVDKKFAVNVEEMRREEGLLFGNAWLKHRVNGQETMSSTKSLVRVRLGNWGEGRFKKAQWPKDANITHPSVPRPIGSALYLGYGPLIFSAGTTLKNNAAIQAGEGEKLSLAWPDRFPDGLQQELRERNSPEVWPERIGQRLRLALWLADRYGTLGGRSRNGWGSYVLEPQNATLPLQGTVPLRPWSECLDRDWPHAIGQDEKGALIWQTAPHDDWKALMRTLAAIKIGLRTQFRFTTGHGAPAPEARHWLSYPVTKHDVRDWNALRLPNQLRFKVRTTDASKLVGVIFHMPHLPPPAFAPNRKIEEVWPCVHQVLDALTQPANQRRYCAAADRDALHRQKQQLDGVTLKRIPE